MRKIYAATFFIFIIFLIPTQLFANTIEDMLIKVHINEDGSVDVTEERTQNMTEGTENYMVFNDRDLGEVEVTNFSVDGFEPVDDWDSDDSLEEKAGKYGILDTSSGQELVFGIGEYGVNEYTVHYTLENMVRNLDGGQSLYWNFDTFTNLRTHSFTLEITSDVPFEDVDYWGFGFIGDIELIDDRIYWDATNTLTNSHDVVVLLHFPEGTYASNVDVDTSIEEEREEAMDGSIYESYVDEQNSMPTWLKWLFIFGGSVIALLVGLATFVSVKMSRFRKSKGHIESGGAINKRNRGYEEKTAPTIENDDYAGIIYFVKHTTYEAFEALFQLYLMKWSDEGRMTIDFTEGEGWFGADKTEIRIHDYEDVRAQYTTSIKDISKLVKAKGYNGGYEPLLWRFVVEMADESGVITEKTMGQFSKKHAKSIEAIANYLNEYSLEFLEEHQYIETEMPTFYKMPTHIIRPTEKGDALLNHLVQYKNYLKEHDEEVLDNPFDESVLRGHLRWATLLGEHSRYHRLLNKLRKDDTGYDYYPYYLYHHSSMHSRNVISTGLGSGGMHSAMSTAASGGGGTTGGGGGGGAGGGGGGGAR